MPARWVGVDEHVGQVVSVRCDDRQSLLQAAVGGGVAGRPGVGGQGVCRSLAEPAQHQLADHCLEEITALRMGAGTVLQSGTTGHSDLLGMRSGVCGETNPAPGARPHISTSPGPSAEASGRNTDRGSR